MRPRGMALTALLLAAALCHGQLTARAADPQTPPVTPPAAPAIDPQLDNTLTRWQQNMQQITALAAKLKRTTKDQVGGDVKVYNGFTKYLHIGSGGTVENLALLQMTEEGKKDFSQRFVCSGGFLYEYRPSEKLIVQHEAPKPKSGQVSDDNFLSFLFGMKKDDALTRYDLKLDKNDRHPNGVDDYYIYVDVLPRYTADKVDFQTAQLVLSKDTLMPRRLWFREPNQSETTWDVLEIKNNDTNIDRREFDAPTPDPGWKVTKAPKDAETPPRVVRPNGS